MLGDVQSNLTKQVAGDVIYIGGLRDGVGGWTQNPPASIDASGNLLFTGGTATGYGVGSGGTVTQATSKSTTVTLNKPSGQITMNNAALAGNTQVLFLLNNTIISSTDCVVVNVNYSNGGAYQADCVQINNGNCYIRVRNITATSYSEAVVLNFAVIKGATS